MYVLFRRGCRVMHWAGGRETLHALGGPKIALQGGGGRAWAPGEGGGGSRNGLPCRQDGCCHQRRRNTNFGLEIFFHEKKFPPPLCNQNDQRDVGIILSHVCWGRTPPPPPPARQVGQRQPKPPSRHGDQGGGGGGWANGFPCHPPPRKAIFFPPYAVNNHTALDAHNYTLACPTKEHMYWGKGGCVRYYSFCASQANLDTHLLTRRNAKWGEAYAIVHTII